MSQIYIEYDFVVDPVQPGTEILIAELGYAGFESFVENELGIKAYIQKGDWNESILEEIQVLGSNEFSIKYSHREIAQVNWNSEWERNFDPIVVNRECVVRAPFHEPFEVPYEIVIEPKMSFGTGHHETTFMMLQYLLEDRMEAKKVLDMGCGTAVLAILAKKLGAGEVDAIDIDEWCVENSLENAQRNDCGGINVSLGDGSAIDLQGDYDVVIANINRNILLADMHLYAEALKRGGTLYLSGFYREDLEIVKGHCAKLGFKFESNQLKNNWIAAKFLLS